MILRYKTCFSITCIWVHNDTWISCTCPVFPRTSSGQLTSPSSTCCVRILPRSWRDAVVSRRASTQSPPPRHLHAQFSHDVRTNMTREQCVSTLCLVHALRATILCNMLRFAAHKAMANTLYTHHTKHVLVDVFRRCLLCNHRACGCSSYKPKSYWSVLPENFAIIFPESSNRYILSRGASAKSDLWTRRSRHLDVGREYLIAYRLIRLPRQCFIMNCVELCAAPNAWLKIQPSSAPFTTLYYIPHIVHTRKGSRRYLFSQCTHRTPNRNRDTTSRRPRAKAQTQPKWSGRNDAARRHRRTW